MLSPDLLSLEVVIDDGTDDETNECVGGSARCDNTFVAAVEVVVVVVVVAMVAHILIAY